MLISSSYLEFSNQPKQNRCPAQIPVQWSGVPIAIRGPNEARLTKEKIVREIKHRSEVRIYNRSSFCHSFHSGSLNGMTLSTAPFESRMQNLTAAKKGVALCDQQYSRSPQILQPLT